MSLKWDGANGWVKLGKRYKNKKCGAPVLFRMSSFNTVQHLNKINNPIPSRYGGMGEANGDTGRIPIARLRLRMR